MKKSLRHGYTTGACATAAALGATRMLHEQRLINSVKIDLPAGFPATFDLHGQKISSAAASCFVIKDAGDDPDVTHGAEVHAEVRVSPESPPGIVIEGGEGIGRVTKPGLAVPVGEWAINPVPRQMIAEAVGEVLQAQSVPSAARVTISIPDGVQRAGKTLNERLGIIGGLSILGTTGVVKPISHKAWTDTLDAALDVALACGCRTVICSTGRTSEQAAQHLLRPAKGEGQKARGLKFSPLTICPLPEEAFVMMGDHVGYTLEACHRRGISGVVVAAQFAKLIKIACGHPQTHAGRVELDLGQVADWVREGKLDGDLANRIELANTARQLFEVPEIRDFLLPLVAERAIRQLGVWGPDIELGLLVVDYHGRLAGRFGFQPEED